MLRRHRESTRLKPRLGTSPNNMFKRLRLRLRRWPKNMPMRPLQRTNIGWFGIVVQCS